MKITKKLNARENENQQTKMNVQWVIKNMATLITLGILTAFQANAQDLPKTAIDTTVIQPAADSTKKSFWATTGFNAIETAITHQGNARIRTYAELGLSYKGFELGINGMNEFTQDLTNYFGRNDIIAWFKGMNLKLIGVVKANAEGIIDETYGLRYMISDKWGIDYGRVDITANGKRGDVTFFLGKHLGKTWSLELFESAGIDYQGKISPYTELQLNKEIFKWLNIFVRGEMAGVEYKDMTYLLGISKILK